MFVIFSGVSGAGKQTIIDAMMHKFDKTEFLKSATTRKKREGETAHYFFTQQQFDKRVQNNEFFEYENVHGYMYGILHKDLKRVVDNPDMIFFKDVDVHGTEKLVRYLKGKADVITIFLDVPDEVLYKRLAERGEKEERIKVRLSRGDMERACKDSYDYILDNIDLDKTINKVEKIIKKHQK